ncbi:hypothetical protein EST38_g9345 [Candolleomyces aberdarensis]|uniref:UvrD-like helicase ATP-binding domain-containing protein n=1 Tax=Candolleomyces aberdarensis TaxID=2316362 RepID=A0A4Q2DA55_9AGAR|nr:hypothetical protein EST38_g9345 [Candolleomyces aberdarensis]
MEPEAQPAPVAYPGVQPIKAALYFESAPGLGAWRILISTRADRELREARRDDTTFFKSVIKKIVHLSKGRFYEDNQKRLNQLEDQVPVYEAKLPDDRQLVYQIDCIPEYDQDLERQVIKIFGIYTRAQLDNDKRFWDSMASQLAQKGEEYRYRCTFREAYHRGDGGIPPAEFSLQNLEEAVPNSNTNSTLPKEDLEGIHSLLVLEKFVTLSKELLYSIFADLEVAHVFNVSSQEKEIIEHPNSCYVLGRSGTGKTTTMLFKMLGIERAYTQQSVAKPRQIFVTQSRVLATRVEEYFSELLQSLAAGEKSNEELKEMAARKKLQKEGDDALYDVDDDVMQKADLPKKFSLLRDKHFPLFLTFEQLCQLLESDIGNAAGITGNSERQLITYNVFLEQYWPHFPQGLTKNLDPALVFNELLGVIKGSEQSLSHATGYLDLTSYSNLSHRTQHLFANQRDQIYSLFQAYMKRRRPRGETDSADRTHRILKAFDAAGIPGTKIDYLYVDEAQDNLLIDAMLLRSLCRNPDGLFWAGDTAQTIAIGSSFRFNDLKAFLYRVERCREQGERGRKQSELRTFQLAVNYRSHAGIVRCATAVIELITYFWPYAIDSLAPEQGVVDGAKPVFFGDWDPSTEQFRSGDSGKRIEFGARQCILVRDDAAKDKLQKQVGDIGLILTLYESKGLEFDDVLLYKFWEDSTVGLKQWRVVLNLIETRSVHAPSFDEERHAGVCSELKFLYVAITRSRKNLWIVDCSEKAEPMKMLWDSKGFIHIHAPGGDVPRLAVSSTPEEWASTGRTLFASRRYAQAMHAFERAGRTREARISHTYYLRDNARSIGPFSKEAKRNAFRRAAESFLECTWDAEAKERRVFFHSAAECFERAGSCGDNMEDYVEAAQAYEEAKEYTPAVRLYKKTEMFDEAIRVVQSHRQEVDEELASEKAETLFESVDEQLQYLEDNILLDDCHAAVLAKHGKHQEAAEIHMKEGRTMEAIDALLDDKKNELESRRRANDWIFQGLWENTSFSRKIEDADTAALEFLQRAFKVDKDAKLLSPTRKDELELFQNLRKSDGASIFRWLAYRFLGRKEHHQAVLCFDHYFIKFPSTLQITNADMVTILGDFGQYCRSFRDLILELDVANEDTQRLFNFRPASIGNAYRVRTKTWLYEQTTDASAKLQVLERDDEFITVSSDELQHFLQAVLWQRLERRILDENSLCHRIPVFTPCLPFVMNDVCNRTNCSRHHVNYQELTQEWFNRQIRIHLLQILIYHVYLGIPTPKNRDQTIQDKRYWIHRFYETLRPAAHYLGSEASVRQGGSKVPEAVLGSQTVVKWLRDILGNREMPFDRMLLTFLCEGASLLMRFDPNARVDLMRAPLLGVLESHRYLYRLEGTVYVVPELYHCLRAADRTFISAGIVFFQHMVDRKIYIDVNVLCHLAEFLAGSVILARVKFNLHNVVLPRGWILALLNQIAMKEPDTMLLDRLLFSMKALLEGLVKGGEEANEMVQLCSNEKPRPQRPSPEGIRRVFFKNLQDVPLVLSTGALVPQAKAFIPSSLKSHANGVRGDDNSIRGQGGELEQQIEQPEADVTDLVDSRNIVDSLASTTAPLVVDHISQEQKDVALCLLRKHRQRARNQKLVKNKTPTQKVCDSYFETCLKVASDPKEMQWPCGSHYRKLYLGLVPHLLACVKAVESYALSAWSEARDQSRKEKQDYDGMYKTKSEIIAILKESRKLGSRLDPSSEVHRKRDVEGLKQLAREVEQLVNRVPSGAGLDVRFNLQLAMKGISNAGPERG